MAQPTTLEDAIRRQLEVQVHIEQGLPMREREWRSFSLKEGYTYHANFEIGMGWFVHDPDGEYHECEMKWFDHPLTGSPGVILICPVCFLEGT